MSPVRPTEMLPDVTRASPAKTLLPPPVETRSLVLAGLAHRRANSRGG
jgi:hypothetical protein